MWSTLFNNSYWLILLLYIIISVFNIEFSPSAYTVSEDDGFIDLVITKTVIGDAVSSNQNVIVLFSTSDGTALGL